MASVMKCMSLMAGAGLLGGAGATYYVQSKVNNFVLKQAEGIAKDGKIPIGGQKPDGTMWDGSMTVEDYKKQLQKKNMISSFITGALVAIGTSIISGLTLLLRGKIK